MKKNLDAERIRAAFKATQGIVEHSFEQHVIDASRKHPANTALPSDPVSPNLVPT